ncbi:hypothetical protein [Serratia surfactantfaciens]|uniref:hypothetical protein n=1 Tax=Serratia surfactantfaciens TaxID=2741499 RepID=UPI003EE38DA4
MNVKTAIERSRKRRTFSNESGQGEKRIPYWTLEGLHKLNKLELELRREHADKLVAQYRDQLSPATQEALIEVLTLKGSREYITTHGAMSTLMTALLSNGVAEELEACIAVYTAMYPNSLDYVLKTAPAKVHNYLCIYSNSADVITWAEGEPDWENTVITSLKNGSFRRELRRMRYATQSMTLNPQAMNAINRLVDDVGGIAPATREALKGSLELAPEALCLSPREWCVETNNVRDAILYLLFIEAQNRFGKKTDNARICRQPFYDLDRERAGMHATAIITFTKGTEYAEKYDFGLCVGWRYDSWEQFFYQACFGAVLLLNPKTTPATTALETGVAYKFAEEMMDKYLPYASRRRLDSPAGTGNAYDQALQAASKLPDEVLHQIRAESGSFGEVPEPTRFAAMTSAWLTSAEAERLSKNLIP